MADSFDYGDGFRYHWACAVEELIAEGKLSPAARDMDADTVRHQYVEANALTVTEADDPAEFPQPTIATYTPAGAEMGPCSRCNTPILNTRG